MIRSACSVLGFAALALVACGGDKASTTGDASAKGSGTTAGKPPGNALKGACDRRAKENVCGAYYGGNANKGLIEKECAAMNATFVESCPTEKAVGTCIRDKGTAMETRTTFYDPMTKETVKAMCSGGEVEGG